jgi:hypothetical protein
MAASNMSSTANYPNGFMVWLTREPGKRHANYPGRLVLKGEPTEIYLELSVGSIDPH